MIKKISVMWKKKFNGPPVKLVQGHSAMRNEQGITLIIPYPLLFLMIGLAVGTAMTYLSFEKKPLKGKVGLFEKNQSRGFKKAESDYCNFANRRFQGKINNQYLLEMNINSLNGIVTGFYQYTSEGNRLKLEGEIDSDGSLVLFEYDQNGNQTGVFEMNRLDSIILQGEWHKPDNSSIMPFILVAEVSPNEVENKYNDSIYTNMSYMNGEFTRSTEKGLETCMASLQLKYLGLNKMAFQLKFFDGNEVFDIREGIMCIGPDKTAKADLGDIQLKFELSINHIRLYRFDDRSDKTYSGYFFRSRDTSMVPFYTS
jgi:hypothetical protein